jgi:hypothetical protein
MRDLALIGRRPSLCRDVVEFRHGVPGLPINSSRRAAPAVYGNQAVTDVENAAASFFAAAARSAA